MKKWVIPVIIAVIVLGCGGFGVLAMQVLKNKTSAFNRPQEASAEWKAYSDAMSKGDEGLKDLQELMKSATDDAVASNAGHRLVDDREGLLLFFEAFPDCRSYRQDNLASSAYYYGLSFWEETAVVISGDEDPARDGAELFVRIAGTRYKAGGGPYVTGAEEQIAKALIDAVPRATGEFEEHLAYTISLYHPVSHDKLVEYLGHEDAKVRRIAVAALGRLEVEEARGKIEMLKQDTDKEVRVAAFTAMDTLDAALVVVPATHIATERERIEAKKALGMP